MNKELFEENDRNIRVFGLETMKKLFETEVLILGFSPAMTELSKNLILSGAGICIFDMGAKIEHKNTENNFVFNVKDIGKNKAIVLKEKIKLFKDPCKINIINDINEIKNKKIKYGVVDISDSNIKNSNIIKELENIMIENKGLLYYIKLVSDKGIFVNNILEKKFSEFVEKEGKEKESLFKKDENITEHLQISDDEDEENNNKEKKNEDNKEEKKMEVVDVIDDEEKKEEILKEDDYTYLNFDKKIEQIKNLIPNKLKTSEQEKINSAFGLINIKENCNEINPLNCLVNYIIGGIVCHEIVNCISKKKNIRTNIYYFDGFNDTGKFLNELYDKTI